jgi:hypothetical protein
MNISDATKTQLLSMAKTFGTVFIVTVAMVLTQENSIEWTSVFWFSIISAGLRAAVSAVIAPFIPVKLGGKK